MKSISISSHPKLKFRQFEVLKKYPVPKVVPTTSGVTAPARLGAFVETWRSILSVFFELSSGILKTAAAFYSYLTLVGYVHCTREMGPITTDSTPIFLKLRYPMLKLPNAMW